MAATKQNQCGHCGKTAKLRCSRCNAKWYCCKDHQITDWKQSHKLQCKKLDRKSGNDLESKKQTEQTTLARNSKSQKKYRNIGEHPQYHKLKQLQDEMKEMQKIQKTALLGDDPQIKGMFGAGLHRMRRTESTIITKMKNGDKIYDFEFEEYNDDNDICGIPDDMCDELMCQGIKPWDDDAYSALSVLYDFDSY